MRCTKNMLVIGGIMLAVLAAAYFALPQFRALVVSVGPFLLILLCPLSMLFMMKGMNSRNGHSASTDDSSKERSSSSESQLKH